MSKKSEYVVTSETTRVEEGRPDLCWMDIGIDKLDRCCEADEVYYFQCDIGGEQFEFCKEACELRDAFVREDVYKKTNVGGTSYSFYLDYRKGVIYKSKTKGHPPVILLDPVGELHLPEGVNQTTKRKPAMKKKPEYVVTSETTRVKEGRPDLCWMDINVDKLDRCCEADEAYYFRCDIGGKQYKFYKEACELRDAFVREEVHKKTNAGGTSYSFYLDYREGAIYKSKTRGLPPVILLNPLGELHLLERVNRTTKTRPIMNKKPEYVVTSETPRVKEGRPDLCWMDINVDKLDRCCEADEVYYFQCDIRGRQYKFYTKACKLKDAFVKKDVYKKKNKGGTAYSFYLDYRKGVIYKSETKVHLPVILLNPVRESE